MTNITDITLSYYQEHAKEFVSGTRDVDFSKTADRFLAQFPENLAEAAPRILDFGCGAGRDSKYFLERGYEVEAVDGSAELCRMTEAYLGIPVKCMRFQELNEVERYDGIWACASILHVPLEELADVWAKMIRALKPEGILYASFKYSDFRGSRHGRYFTDFKEESFALFAKQFPELELVEQWISGDVRAGREGEGWLNVIMKKTEVDLSCRKVEKLAIVSLSSGAIGEDFTKHEVNLGLSRLQGYGLEVQMMPHAQKGIAYVKEHPEDRASDLIKALADDSVDMILCAIGGDDTYRLAPYLFEGDVLAEATKEKIFLGFSDTTMNHLMLHKVGLPTFYGQSFLADVCEMEEEMLPYTKKYFEEMINTGTIKEIRPSDVWYEERQDWSEAALGTARVSHPNEGFQLLQGAPVFSGKILGGCVESMFDLFDNSRYEDTVAVAEQYGLFPELEDWTGRILLLETSEEQPSPEHYRKMLTALKKTGVFKVVSGVLCGKPMDERFFEEYKKIIVEVVDNPALPIVANINVGHATPRCIIPFGKDAVVDATEQVIRFTDFT